METKEERLIRQRAQAAHARATKAANVAKYRRVTQTISLTVRKETLDSLMVEAERREITRHDLVREILDDYVKRNHLLKRTKITWNEK